MPPDRLPRTTMGLAMLLAPAAGLVAACAQPALRDTTDAEITAIAAQPGRFYVYAISILISGYLLVPAFLGVMALLRERAPRWTALAGGLTVAGLLIAVGDGAVELVYWQMGAPGADHAQMVALADRYETAPGSSLIYTIGGLASLIGVLLITGALWRTRVVPRWAAVGLLLGSVAQIVGFAVANQPLLIASYVVLFAGFAPMALRLFGVVAPTGAAVPAGRSAVAATAR